LVHALSLLNDRAPETAETLGALSEEELLEVIASLTATTEHPAPSAMAHCELGSNSRDTSPGAVISEFEELRQQLQQSAERIAVQEGEQERKAALLEARETQLSEKLERWQAEREAEAQDLQHVELRTEARCSGEQEPQVELRLLKEQRAELEQLRAKTIDATHELMTMQDDAKRAADERELRLLEAEEEHFRIGDALREEQESLERERRKVMLLQRSLLANASVAAHSLDSTHTKCLEVTLDDPQSDGDAGSPANTKGHRPEDAAAGKAVLEDTGADAEDRFGMEEGNEEEEEEEEGEDAEEEVWDIDWSTLSPCKVEEPTSPAFHLRDDLSEGVSEPGDTSKASPADASQDMPVEGDTLKPTKAPSGDVGVGAAASFSPPPRRGVALASESADVPGNES